MPVGTEHDAAVPTLIPPQLPALIFSNSESYSCAPRGPRQPHLSWLPVRQQQQQQPEQADQLTHVRQQISRVKGTSNGKRLTPTASGNIVGSSAGSSRPVGRSPADILFGAVKGAGIGAGVGGIVSRTAVC